jgi:hypothetical protein
LSQTIFAVDSAMDEFGSQPRDGPFEFRRRNVISPGDPMTSLGAERATSSTAAMDWTSVSTWFQEALARGNGVARPEGRLARRQGCCVGDDRLRRANRASL